MADYYKKRRAQLNNTHVVNTKSQHSTINRFLCYARLSPYIQQS